MNRNIPEKPFSVVFKRQTPLLDDEAMPETSLLHLHTQHKKIARNIPKPTVEVIKFHRSSIEQLITEPAKGNETYIDDAKFKKLLMAVEDSTEKEIRVTDKFVNDIECLMNSVNNNLGKLQSAYENIMKKLLKVDPNK